MTHFRVLASVLLVGSAVAVATGCGSDNPITAVQHQITCHDICKRYADCYDHSYDVDSCTNRCTDDVSGDDQKDAKLRQCNACMDDKSCLSTVFNCAVDCSPFLP